MRKNLWIPATAGGVALALVSTVGIASALHKNDIELVVDGAASSIAVRENTVSEVLELEGITVGEHDVVLPEADTRITQDMEITVAYGRPLTVTVDGKQRQVWTTATSVGEALGFLNLDQADSKLSASRSTSIGRTGLVMEVATAKDVTITVAGAPTQLTIAGTVSDALAEAGVTPDADDIVTPEPATVLTDGLQVTFVDVEVSSSSKSVAVPFSSAQITSDTMEKGTKKVTTKGVPGVKRETWTDVHHDGALISSTLAESVMSKQPVHQVTTVGTLVKKVEPAPAAPKAKASSTPSKSAEPKSSKSEVPNAEAPKSESSSGKGINLARADMWDRIARCESTNNWSINTGNGYYGGLQFNLQTWRSVNGQDFAAYPHQASRAEQITVANRLYAIRGTQPWSCA
ncbi:MAG: transglycosylase family protein [Propionibacteriaceae bacterium]|nr:transglycosylase family protein [Propionibacteriaceae bacterium]